MVYADLGGAHYLNNYGLFAGIHSILGDIAAMTRFILYQSVVFFI